MMTCEPKLEYEDNIIMDDVGEIFLKAVNPIVTG